MVASLLAFVPRTAAMPSRATAVNGPASGPSLATLPRFQRLWSRAGLGRFEGATRGSAYYTVANDARSVHALDVTTGQTLWTTSLPIPVDLGVQLDVADDAVVLAYSQKFDSPNAIVARLSTSDGRLHWSRVLPCRQPFLMTSGPDSYLACTTERDPTTLGQLDPATGEWLRRASLSGFASFAPGGRVYGIRKGKIWAGRLVGEGIAVDWRVPGATTPSDHLEDAGPFLVQSSEKHLVVRRLADGKTVWKRSGAPQITVDPKSSRVFLLGDGVLEVLRLENGARLMRLPSLHKGMSTITTDGEVVLLVPVLVPVLADKEPVYLLGPQLRLQPLDRNVKSFDQMAAGVLLSRDVGSSGINQRVATLQAYSLSRFAPPQDRLDPYQQVFAVLERHSHSRESHPALAALRPIPEAMSSLVRVIRTEPELRSAAIGVAERTADPRFLAPLRERLQAIQTLPVHVDEWAPVIHTAQAVAALDTPEAATVLLDFWKRIGFRVSPAWRRVLLRDTVASGVWRWSGRKTAVTCPDLTFPVERTPPDQAEVGTASPGVAYAVDVDRKWAAVCQARHDDNGDGKLEIVPGQHGELVGDAVRPYLVLGSGAGTEIDDFVDADPSGRWVVVTKDLCVHLVDTLSGKTVALPGADGRPGDAVFGGHRAASFSPDGVSVLYRRTEGRRALVIVRDLVSGSERAIDPGAGELQGAFFEKNGRLVVMEVTGADTNRDGEVQPQRVASTLGKRRCRGPIASYSTHGIIGDQPVLRTVARDGRGAVAPAPAGSNYEPATTPPAAYELAPRSAGVSLRGPLPPGPFRWKRP